MSLPVLTNVKCATRICDVCGEILQHNYGTEKVDEQIIVEIPFRVIVKKTGNFIASKYIEIHF